MQTRTTLAMAVGVTVAGVLATGVLWGRWMEPSRVRAPLVMTGAHSEVTGARYQLVASQELFDLVWKEHQGETVELAAQGWPIVPEIDFESFCVLWVFGGETANSNGYRVVEVTAGGVSHSYYGVDDPGWEDIGGPPATD